MEEEVKLGKDGYGNANITAILKPDGDILLKRFDPHNSYLTDTIYLRKEDIIKLIETIKK
jgi:hypothetical protein